MPKERGKRSGKFCVAAGCNSTHKHNVSLHEFPGEDRLEIRKLWVRFVRTKRRDFVQPNPHTVLCEKHFTPDSYPAEYSIKQSLGIEVKLKRLLPHAVPTIHSEILVNTTPSNKEYVYDSSIQMPATPKSAERTAYRKRECMRLLLDDSSESRTCSTTATTGHDYMDECGVQPLISATEETDETAGEYGRSKCDKGTQFAMKKPKRSIRVQTHPRLVSKAVQVDIRQKPEVHVASVGTQCSIQAPIVTEEANVDMSSESSESDIEETDRFSDDLTYEPVSDEDISDSDSEIQSEEKAGSTPTTERKYIVFESQLLELFKFCPLCASPSLASIKAVMGSLLKIEQTCGVCGLFRQWKSQPMVGTVPAGNLLISASVLLSGLIPCKAMRFLDHLNVGSISLNTFFNHQKHYLQPAISTVWKSFQDNYFQKMQQRGRALTLGGDGRADSPGHSAKYGSYTFIDLDLMMVIDIQLVQSNEVKSSCHMEKEGFMRGVNLLKSKGLCIEEIVTDRHVMIVKFIRENMPDTTHHFDVWHVGKALKKKLVSLSREKECEMLTNWIKSICNHLYWVAASTPGGEKDLMLAKWQSLLNHIHNVHVHENESFPKCTHSQLEGNERRKKWLKPGTKVSVKLEDIVHSKQMTKDIPMLSPGPQTASVESFHGVVNHFAPKMYGFSYHGMLSRLRLAGLHYNENGLRDQAVTKDGDKRYNIVFPKYKKGDYSLREVKVDCTFGYVHKVLDVVISNATSSSMRIQMEEIPQRESAPPPLCSVHQRPDKHTAIQNFASRYKNV